MTIKYTRLTEEGDESDDVTKEKAQEVAKADLDGKCPGWDKCPLNAGNGKMKKIRKVPRLVIQKKKGKNKREVVTKPEDITEETEEVISTPDARTG
jgi:hypothetical protein